MMNVLVIGSGGREHAIIEKISESPKCNKIFAMPGNAGTANIAENVDMDTEDIGQIIDFVKENNIDLTIVGPEKPLTHGIVNRFNSEGLVVFGPTKEAAEIESSKSFAKEIMTRYRIPTASYKVFSDYDKAENYLKRSVHPIVVKASGLAAGKGALICNTVDESIGAAKKIMIDKCFGDAGNEIVIEDYLEGEEASVLAISDGNNYKILVPAQDHKAAFDKDIGPNTGGMGAYAPSPAVSNKMLKTIDQKIIAPTIKAMKNEDRIFKGVLFAGLMLTPNGPKVIEFNCRFGDPETQVILPLLDGDLVDIMMKAAKGEFDCNGVLPQKNAHCLSLVLASGGYPEKYFKGYEIRGLEKVSGRNISIIHAGTISKNGKILTAGGRVLNIVAVATTLKDAKKQAYDTAAEIDFKDKYFRSDIGDKGIEHYRQDN
ncbi:MAG: phosphoribosylamine--glycine ligase [Candidatus Delongbacteria bacterium]